MARYDDNVAGEDGWCDWVRPIMDGFKAACCDCGLVHELEFRVVRVGDEETLLTAAEYRVELRARRNNRSTGQIRRHMERKLGVQR